MKTNSRTAIMTLVLLVAIAGQTRAANPIVEWNEIALTMALTTPGTQVYLTDVHLAAYDAANAIDRRYQVYGPEFRGLRDASKEAAAISAACQILLNYFPAQAAALQAQYDTAIAAIPDGAAKIAGIAVGQVAAARIVALRTGDRRGANVPYSYPPPSPIPGVWIATPPAFAPPVTPWIGQMVPFTMRSASQFLPVNGPPDLATEQGFFQATRSTLTHSRFSGRGARNGRRACHSCAATRPGGSGCFTISLRASGWLEW